jgi:ABC-type glycerol-3-phosphate transport system substrate-binding protein
VERRKFLKSAGLAGVLASGTAPAIVNAQENIRWRLASSFPKSLDNLIGAAETFAKNVSESTGGKFTVTVHAAGELMPAFGVVDALQQGTIECANTAPYYFFGKDEAFAFDCAIPFGMNSRQLTAWMYEGNGLKLLREFYAQYNIVTFPLGNTGAQMGGWYRMEIKSVAAGECGVAVSNSYYLARLLRSTKPEDKKAMEKVGIIWPNQKAAGTHINISGGGMLKTAPHKEAAVLFLEYLASDDAQRYFADGNNEWPVVPSVTVNNAALESLGKFKADALPVATLAKNAATAQKVFDRAGWK